MKTVRERAKEYSLRDFDGYYTGREKALEEGYIAGSTEQKAIDEEVRLKKCDDTTEAEYDREVAFADWYHKNVKGTPTFSDAIEWARKDLLDKVCDWLKENAWSFAHVFDGEPYYDTEMVINALETAMEE